jgi:hypothetical protein
MCSARRTLHSKGQPWDSRTWVKVCHDMPPSTHSTYRPSISRCPTNRLHLHVSTALPQQARAPKQVAHDAGTPGGQQCCRTTTCVASCCLVDVTNAHDGQTVLVFAAICAWLCNCSPAWYALAAPACECRSMPASSRSVAKHRSVLSEGLMRHRPTQSTSLHLASVCNRLQIQLTAVHEYDRLC